MAQAFTGENFLRMSIKFMTRTLLIVNDLSGLNPEKRILARAYADLHGDLSAAFAAYRADVEEGRFPAADNARGMSPEKLAAFRAALHAPDGGSPEE